MENFEKKNKQMTVNGKTMKIFIKYNKIEVYL